MCIYIYLLAACCLNCSVSEPVLSLWFSPVRVLLPYQKNRNLCVYIYNFRSVILPMLCNTFYSARECCAQIYWQNMQQIFWIVVRFVSQCAVSAKTAFFFFIRLSAAVFFLSSSSFRFVAFFANCMRRALWTAWYSCGHDSNITRFHSSSFKYETEKWCSVYRTMQHITCNIIISMKFYVVIHWMHGMVRGVHILLVMFHRLNRCCLGLIFFFFTLLLHFVTSLSLYWESHMLLDVRVYLSYITLLLYVGLFYIYSMFI